MISRRYRAVGLGLAAFAVAPPIWAQAPQCRLPAEIPEARAVPRPAGDAARLGPVAGYTLALSWSPEYCRGKERSARDRFQCAGGNRFGFILHGLWPEGQGRSAPRWCRPASALPPQLVRRNLCRTPSVDLLQHEWAKHGSCVTRSADAYFQAGGALFDAIRSPDMDGLSRRPLTVAAFRRAFAAANPGLSPAAIAIDRNPRGWLEEVRLCLGRRMRPAACPAPRRGAVDDLPLKIWRGRS